MKQNKNEGWVWEEFRNVCGGIAIFLMCLLIIGGIHALNNLDIVSAVIILIVLVAAGVAWFFSSFVARMG